MSLQDLFAALGGGFSGYGEWDQRHRAEQMEKQRMAAAEKARLDDVQFRNTQAAKQDWQTRVTNDRADQQFKAGREDAQFDRGRAAFGDTAPNVELTGLAADYAKLAGVGKQQQFLPGADAPKTTGIFDMLAGGAKTDTGAFQDVASKFVRPMNVQEQNATRQGAKADFDMKNEMEKITALKEWSLLDPAKRNSHEGDALLGVATGKTPYADYLREKSLNDSNNAAALNRTIAGVTARADAKPETPRVAGLKNALSQINYLIEKGKTLGPKATGMVQGRLIDAQGRTGLGGKIPQELLDFQSQLSRFGAGQIHDTYGGALSKGEEARSKTWVADIQTDWQKNLANLTAMKAWTEGLLGEYPDTPSPDDAPATGPIVLTATPRGRASGPGGVR